MNACALVVDSSYLWDLFGVPHRDRNETEPERQERQGQMKKRFIGAASCAARIYVPYAVIFETANSIAKIDDDTLRKTVSKNMLDIVERSIVDSTPWVIPPMDGTYLQKRDLLILCQRFRDTVMMHVGLTDVAIAHEAQRLKLKYTAENRHVHIWTTDKELKKHEPDRVVAKCPGY